MELIDIVTDACVAYNSGLSRGDLPAIEKLVRSTGMFNEDEIRIARELGDEYLEKGSLSGYNFVVASINGRMAGFTCFGPIPGAEKRYEIYWIAVDRTFQGRGIGSGLIQKTECLILRHGGRRSYVETSSRSEYLSTHKFYLANGYSPVAELLDYYREGDGKLIFMKLLGEQTGFSQDPSDDSSKGICPARAVAN